MAPLPATAAISAAILAYEVLLTRLFAIVQWHHFAFMAITIALLGFGAAGALLAVLRERLAGAGRGAMALAAGLFAAAAAPAFLLAQQVPFNALEIVWRPSQLLHLGVVCALLAVPFTAGAAAIGLAFIMAGEATGRVYLANLLGSGAGALAAVGALSVFMPAECLLVVSALGLLAAALAGGRRARLAAGTLALAGAALWTAAPPASTRLHMTEYKGLSRALGVEGARLLAERSGPLALLSIVESPAVPFRIAPGLSLLAPASPPPQLGVFIDGDSLAAIDGGDPSGEGARYLAFTTDALAYALTRRPRVLVLGAGGGQPVRQALANGAASVDAVEADAGLVRLVAADFASFSGGLYARPEVRIHIAGARQFLAAHDGPWDLIRLPDLGPGGGAAAGRGLGESTMLTVEAFAACLARLAPGGWLSVAGGVELPPRGALKLAATAMAALAGAGVDDPASRLLLVRGPSAFVLLVKAGPVEAGEIAAARAFAGDRAFDLDWHAGLERTAANQVNVLAANDFFDGIAALAGEDAADFIARYKFDIAPASDDRPYFHSFFKWTSAPELIAMRSGGGAGLMEWGELVVAATLAGGLVLAPLLILLPLRLALSPRAPPWRVIAYFSCLGLAFLFIEIAFIQKLTLFLGHPIHAVSVALTGFLVFAGIGAGASGLLERRLASPASAIPIAAAGITATALALLAVLPPLLQALAGLPDVARIALALALIAPLAFLMGMPFPLGLARLARSDAALVPWAFGINGCASVIAAAAATLIAMHAGFTATVAAAVVLYALGALALRRAP
jgi:spermidine synthase